MSVYAPDGRPEIEIDVSAILRYVPAAVIIIAAIALVATSLYTVDADSEAVLLRFGRNVGIFGPGLHFKLPFGIDRAYIVPVRKVEVLEFGFQTSHPGRRTIFAPRTNEMKSQSLMLTGDLTGAAVQWTVQYRIKEVLDYLQNVEDVPDSIEDVSEAVMRRLVGDRSVDEVITVGREELAVEARDATQKVLDQYGCGVELVALTLKNATPPDPVKDAFDAVNRALQDKDRLINEALGERNKIIPAARGKRDQVIKEAEGYYERKTKEATGDSNAFLARWAEYQKAPGPARARLYLEAMEEVLSGAGDKIVIDEQLKGIVPLLDVAGKGVRYGQE